MGKFLANGIDLILDDHIKLMENFFFSHTIVLNSRHNIILSRRSISLIYSKKAISEASEYLYKSIYHSNSLSKYVFFLSIRTEVSLNLTNNSMYPYFFFWRKFWMAQGKFIGGELQTYFSRFKSVQGCLAQYCLPPHL